MVPHYVAVRTSHRKIIARVTFPLVRTASVAGSSCAAGEVTERRRLRRRRMRAMRRWAALLAALQLAVFAIGLTPAQAAGGTGAVEVNYQDPVTALPPVSRPASRHCTVTEMRQDFANTISSPPYTGTVTPPAACPGPWAKVVLD